MELDASRLSPRENHKLLIACVVPRPIALVTTVDPDGRVNAAPFSFFNAVGSDPPAVVVAPGNRAGRPKDTAHNIRLTGEFVVNIVDEAMARAMNITAVDFPPEVDELAAAGLTPAPSAQVRPPRIARAPASLECRHVSTVEVGRNRIVIGQVVHWHIRDDLIDATSLHVDARHIGAIGRMHGPQWYVRTSDAFELPRISYAEWQDQQAGGGRDSRD